LSLSGKTLTRKFISEIQPPDSGQVFYRDDGLKGLGLRVTKNSMSYVVESRVNRRTRRITIGSTVELTPEQARKKAHRLLAEMPARSTHQGAKVPTLADILAEYPTKKRLRESTITNYQQVVRRYLSDWQHLPVTAITKEMVFARHRELGDRVSGNYANLIMQVLRTLLYFAMEHHELPDGQPIISVNPVSRLSKNHMWYRKRRRQGVIPDHKLADWYRERHGMRKHKRQRLSPATHHDWAAAE
jgi:hypothetical protein